MRRILFVPAAIATLVATGCGGSGETTTDETPAAQSPAAESPAGDTWTTVATG